MKGKQISASFKGKRAEYHGRILNIKQQDNDQVLKRPSQPKLFILPVQRKMLNMSYTEQFHVHYMTVHQQLYK